MKRATAMPSKDEVETVIPRALIRGMLMNLRLLHHWQRELRRACESKPEYSPQPYKLFTEINLQPDVHAVIKMIESAKASGHLTEAEAANLVEGQPIEILCSGIDGEGQDA